MTDRSPVELVEAYIAASQRARASSSEVDFAEVRSFLAEDVTIRLAAPWADRPWRTVFTAADDVIARLREPINQGSSLTTENVNLVQAGDDVLVEQLSTIQRDGVDHSSMVCHIFSISAGRITGIRTYRNDAGLPAG